MKLQHIAVIFVIIIVPLTLVLSTYISTGIKTIRYTSKYDSYLIDATYDALKAYQLNSFNNNISSLSNSKIRDIEASINVYFNTLASDFKAAGYTYDQMVGYTPALLFSLYDGYYVYTRNFDVEKSATAGNRSELEIKMAEESQLYNYGLKPFVYYSCRYVTPDGKYDFVVNYTLDNKISVIGKVNGNNNVTKSGPLVFWDAESEDGEGDEDRKTVKTLAEEGERLSDTLLIVNNDGNNSNEATAGEYEYIVYNNQKVYLNYDWHNPGNVENVKYNPEDVSEANREKKNYLFFKYSSDYTKDYVSSPGDIDYLIGNLKKYGEDYHLYSYSARDYFNDGKEFTTWCKDNLGEITQYDAVDSEGNPLVSREFDSYYCKFVTDIGEEKIFDINQNNNPLLPGSAFNEHRISVIRYSIESNLSSAMASYITKENKGYVFAMPVFSEDDWHKIENNVCISSFLQGMPVGNRIYDKYYVLSNNSNKDAIDLESIYTVAKVTDQTGDTPYVSIEYHMPGCHDLLHKIMNTGYTVEILGFYQTSDFKRRNISISGEDINALSQLNNMEGTNFNYYYYHTYINAETPKGACYECIVNATNAYSAAEMIKGIYYDYEEGEYKSITQNYGGSVNYENYLAQFKVGLYRIRNDAYMLNGYFGK